MTGRTPLRCGIPFLDPIRPQEITIAKALKTAGYATGHFGKWHLGSGPVHPTNMGFDISWYSPNFFDTGGKLTCGKETVTVTGDSSVFTMDLAIDWIRKQAGAKTPFFAYVCFGSPHDPHKGADEFKALYKDVPVPAGFQGSFADFYAEISGLDAAVGKLRSALRELTIADNTLVWFTSDNGGIKPFSKDPAGLGKGRIGVRTVACLEWPARVKSPIRTDCACVHMDMYPTILDIAGVTMPHQPVLDGVSLVPLLDGRMPRREKPMGFLSGPSAKELPNTDFIAGTSADRPNLVVILADDLGYETLGAYGGTSYKTPELDNLAATGIRFQHCYSQPLCTPSRVEMLTGMYNVRNYRRFAYMDRDQVTFAQLLKKAGYATCVSGKWQLGHEPDSPAHFGFDEYCLWHAYQTGGRYANPGLYVNGKAEKYPGKFGPDVVSDFACGFLERNRDRPFLLYYPMILVHQPFEPTPDSADWGKKKGGNAAFGCFPDMVAYMDKLVGKLVRKLDGLGLRDNTIVMFTGNLVRSGRGGGAGGVEG
jgi:arylsulfatase A-like enzyme